MTDESARTDFFRVVRLTVVFVWVSACVMLSACTPSVKDSAHPSNASSSAAHNAEDLLIVDCLLPAQVRRLGQMMTYLSARQAIKTTGFDCALRGGEYVAYDRGNYQTALQVWLPLAESGDKAAQTYVGEIYEKGLGVPPDYGQAAVWYRKAAEQGEKRAQLNYGYLYEQGLGVRKDPAEALKWYRKSSGMAAAVELDAGEVQALKQEVESYKRSEESLRRELQQTREQLQKAQEELARRKQQAASEQQRLEDSRQVLQQQRVQAASQGDSERVKSLEAQIQQRTNDLQRQQQDMARLEQVAQQYQEQLVQLELQKARMQTMEQEMSAKTSETVSLRRQLQEAQGKLASIEQDLQQARSKTSSAEQQVAASRQELERQKAASVAAANRDEVAKLEAQLATREQELSRQQAEVRRLNAEAERYQQRLSTLEQGQGSSSARQPPPVSNAQVAMAGPTIQIVEPPVSLTRGSMPAIKTRSGVARAIVGRVSAPAGVASFQVNGRDEKLDDMGLFRAEVPVTRANIPVNVLAVDKQGKRANIQFLFVAEGGAEATAPIAQAPPEKNGFALPVPRQEFGPYYALVIGNNDYGRLPKLETAVSDARGVGDVLRSQYGFEVTTLVNGNRYQILSALSQMREKLTEHDNLLIYYAGHGELDKVNQRGHWLPVDAEPNSTANWISNVDITDILNVMTAKHVLVISDSCYSGTLTRSSLSQLNAGMSRDAKINWYKTMTQKRSRTAFSSGGLAPVLDAGGGDDHSVFAKALLDVLRGNREVMDGARLYREVAARVAYAATRLQMEQVPEYAPIKYAGHDFGDFFFVPSGLTQ